MNCGICIAYLRPKNWCSGCVKQDPYEKGTSLRQCSIRNCETIRDSVSGFCYECATFPYRRLKQLDKRYTPKYSMSMLENLAIIRDDGIEALIASEEEKWKCPECNGVISCHNGICYSCGVEKLVNKRK